MATVVSVGSQGAFANMELEPALVFFESENGRNRALGELAVVDVG